MTTAKEVMKMIKDNDVKYADFRFTDPRGKWQHVTFDITMIEEDTFAEGMMFEIMPYVIILVAVAFAWYARDQHRKGVLR